MRICIIAEGSYPYITGGVSSWVNMLVNAMPEHEFVLYTIFPEEKDKGNFKYPLPANITEIKEVFLDSWRRESAVPRKRLNFNPEEKEVLSQLILGHPFDWTKLFRVIQEKKVTTVQEFLLSMDFFDIVQKAYIESYSQTPFTEFFWTIRSMLLPLFHIIRHPVPPADVYHCPSTGYAGVVGSLAKITHGKPLLITEHGIYTREREIEILKATWMKNYYKDMWIEFFYNLSRCSYQHADRVLTLFGRNRDIQATIGCPPEKIEIIPNGVDIERFESLPRRKFMADGKLVVGAIVRVVPIKDIKTMIQAFAIAKEELPQAQFLIIGPTEEDEAYYEECIQLMEDLKVKDVTFTGRQDVRALIPQIDLFVLSSISEGQPLSILETMAAGKATITTDVGCCHELIYGGENDPIGQAGLVVPIMDYYALGKAIVKLAASPDRLTIYGERGYERVRKYYRLDQMIESYRRVYREAGEQAWQV